MSDESCHKAESAVKSVVPSVDVVGLEKITYSGLLTSLFIASKEWILSLWAGRTDEIENITILHKVIGRNHGFILKVNCIDPTVSTTFYAKAQSASMDTVLIHHLLQNMKCGPDRFHVVLLDGCYNRYHGVITEEVKQWSMASRLTYAQTQELLNEKKKITTTMFLHTLLTELGRFGNIPNNRENWGFIDEAVDSIPYPQMSMIDFSRGSEMRDTFCCMLWFHTYWVENLEYLWKKWEPVCGSMEDLQLFRGRTADLQTSFLQSTVIEEQIPHFPFLQSRKAFVDALQSACDATAQWLHETAQRTCVSADDNNENRDSNNQSSVSPSIINSACNKLFQPFRVVPQPRQMSVSVSILKDEYVRLVDEWNTSVAQLFMWFPFPVNSAEHTSNLANIVEAVGAAHSTGIVK